MLEGVKELAITQDATADLIFNPEIYYGSLTNVYKNYVKRSFDIVFALMLFVLLSPVMLATIAIVKIESAGPAIFKQERLGLGGRAFVIYKFRSMRLDAENSGPVWATKKDTRTTRTGRFLRKYRIDELPQLINIMRGDMSFVGPRPEREYFYEKFERRIPDFRARLVVKPGLTGLAQVNGGYDIGPAEKLRYDKQYIRKFSLNMDMLIVLKTISVVLGGNGAR
jgi:exopolysaccharide biosynthesis polyprenyl glycosylphosphotransferase